MRKAEALARLREVEEEDFAFIDSHYDALIEAGGQYFTMARTQVINEAGKYDRRPKGPTLVAPRPVQRILNKALEDGTDRSRSPDQLHVIAGELLLPNVGLTLPDDDPVINTARLAVDGKGCCEMAEPYFVKALRQINTGRHLDHEFISVYIDSEGTPLLLRKDEEVSTALTLVSIRIGDTIFPPGTIVAVERLPLAENLVGERKRTLSRIRVYKVYDGELELTPRRLSPWAYEDEADRALFGFEQTGPDLDYDHVRARAIVSRTIDDFRAVSHKVLELVDAVS